jgi:hypothetical protein
VLMPAYAVSGSRGPDGTDRTELADCWMLLGAECALACSSASSLWFAWDMASRQQFHYAWDRGPEVTWPRLLKELFGHM